MNGLLGRGDLYAGAEFSPCGAYRYRLWRHKRPGEPFVLWILLNPSIADHERMDRTAGRMESFTKAFGYSNWTAANLFAFKATDPASLYRSEAPVGDRNDAILAEQAGRAALIVCGWGNHGVWGGRGDSVRRMLQPKHDLYALKFTKWGAPEHPLYLKKSLTPRLWVPQEGVR